MGPRRWLGRTGPSPACRWPLATPLPADSSATAEVQRTVPQAVLPLAGGSLACEPFSAFSAAEALESAGGDGI